VRFASLGSGSKGNAWLVESGTTRVMLDCGFGVREAQARLARLGLQAGDLDAILLSHEHSDHVRGALALARHADCPLWATHGCLAMLDALAPGIEAACRITDGQEAFEIDDLCIEPYPVPHDAREPVQYVVGDGRHRWGLLTDAGHVTAHMQRMLEGCDALAIECNHDIALLQAGRYPPALKARILGRFGHLDNAAAAALLASVRHDRLQHVVAAHLSEENNSPDLARAALAGALACAPDWVDVADQADGLGWRDII